MNKSVFALFLVLIFISSCSPSTISRSTATFHPPTKTFEQPTEAPPSPAETERPSLKVAADIQYAKVNLWPTKLDVYSPDGSGPWPIVIVVHGAAQDKSYFSAMSEDIAAAGAVVYNINVNHIPPYEDSVHRIVCALRYARSTADEYGGNPDRVILFGHSGGGLSGLLAALAGDDFGEGCLVEEDSTHIDAFVGYEGVYETLTTKPPEEMSHLDYTHLEEEDPDLWIALNPYSHLGRNPELKVRLVHGDFIESTMMMGTPIEWSINLQQALKDAQYDTELIIVEGADHDDITDPESDAYQQVVDQMRMFILNPVK